MKYNIKQFMFKIWDKSEMKMSFTGGGSCDPGVAGFLQYFTTFFHLKQKLITIQKSLISPTKITEFPLIGQSVRTSHIVSYT